MSDKWANVAIGAVWGGDGECYAVYTCDICGTSRKYKVKSGVTPSGWTPDGEKCRCFDCQADSVDEPMKPRTMLKERAPQPSTFSGNVDDLRARFRR